MSPKKLSIILSIVIVSSVVEANSAVEIKESKNFFRRFLCCCFSQMPEKEEAPVNLIQHNESSYVAIVTSSGKPTTSLALISREERPKEKVLTKSPLETFAPGNLLTTISKNSALESHF